MECIEAQQAISAALDGETVDRDTLAEAKQHCRECPECLEFVRTLAALQRQPMPEPPPDLAGRAAAAARERVAAESPREPLPDAAAAAAASAVETVPGTTAPTSAADSEGATGIDERPTVRERIASMDRTTLGIALAAAATILVFAGIAAIAGVRMIAPVTDQTATEMSAPQEGPPGATLDGGAQWAPAPPAAGDAAPAPSDQVAYVALDGLAYRLEGPSSEATAGLQSVGTVTTSFGQGGAPESLPALSASPDATRIVVEGSSGQFSFALVTRRYAGSTYVLNTGPITSFGQWPILPAGIPSPQSSDGSPTFVEIAQEGGATIFRQASGSTQDGIAVGPGSAPSDPAAGNPNWTWWTPR